MSRVPQVVGSRSRHAKGYFAENKTRRQVFVWVRLRTAAQLSSRGFGWSAIVITSNFL